MSVQSRQALRVVKFIAEMKKNNYPNVKSFTRLLRRADGDENFDFSYSSRTITRDIKTLMDDYHAPIAYDATRRGYYLKNPFWEFSCPIMGDDIFSMTILGTRLASDLLPQPLKDELDGAVERSLTNHNPEMFDEAMIETLLCASGIKAAVDPEVFKTVFEGWKKHQVLAFVYKKPDGTELGRKFEPHIIAFHRGIWYAKGYDYDTKEEKCYAIQRMSNVAFGIDTFITDKKLLEKTHRNGLFVYPRIEGVCLHCDASIAFYLYEHQKIKKFKIEPQKDGSLIITLRPAVEHEVIRWVLGESGHIEVLDPPELRNKIAAAAKRILDKNS